MWAFIVMGGMNPWALQELVKDRNLEREAKKEKQYLGRDSK